MYSQIQSVLYGPEIVNQKKSSFNGFIGENNLNVFSIDYYYSNKKKREVIVNKYYKSDLSLIESKDIYQNPIENFYNEPIEIFYQDGQFFFFSKFINEKDNKTFIGMSIYNENLNQTDFQIIDTIISNSATDIKIIEGSTQTFFSIIQNHKHQLSNRQMVEIKTINYNGRILWQKKLLSTNNVSASIIEKVIVTPTSIYILNNYGYNVNINSSPPAVLANKYTLWIYNPELNFMKEVGLHLKLKWINGVDMVLTPQNNIIISGFVNTSREFGINAVFNIELNQKYAINAVNYYPFTNETLNKFNATKKLEGTTFLPDFFLKDILYQNDGSYFLIGESYRKYIERNYDPRTNITTSVEHFIYGNIIVCYFDPQHKLKYIENVPKSQNTINDFGIYSSFTWLNTKSNQLYLFYNDNEKNNEIPVNAYFKQKELYNYRRLMHTYVQLNDSGVVKRSKLNQDKTNFAMYAKRSNAINSHTMYLFSLYGKKSQLIQVKIDEG
jgi:hypothetical protein